MKKNINELKRTLCMIRTGNIQDLRKYYPAMFGEKERQARIRVLEKKISALENVSS